MKHSVEEITLKNGAKGLLINIPGASVMSTRIQFRAGMIYSRNKNVYEIPHLVEHLAFGANAKYKDEQAFEAEFTKNGAYHNAWTSDISVCYETECADFEWERIMELQQVSICEPRFNEEELKSEKANVRSELTGYMNDYYRLLWPRVQQAVGEDILDLPERIKTISNATVGWRQSGCNITPDVSNDMVQRKLLLEIDYLKWAASYFSSDSISSYNKYLLFRKVFHYSDINSLNLRIPSVATSFICTTPLT